MSDMTLAQTLVTREVNDLEGLFRLLAESDHPVYVTRNEDRAVLLRYQTYQELQERLEDLTDLLVMREVEAEYQAGEARPLDEILAELEAEESADVPA